MGNHFIKNYNEESDEGYFLEVEVQYSAKLHELHDDLLFLPEKMKTKNVEKLVTNLYDTIECVIHIINLKQAWNHCLVKFRVVKFTQNVWLKRYIDMNTKIWQKAKNNFEKDFSSW